MYIVNRYIGINSRVSNIESDNSQNVGLEDYNNISDRIFPHFTTPSRECVRNLDQRVQKVMS